MKSLPWYIVGALTVIIILMILLRKDTTSEYEHKEYQKMITEWRDMARAATKQTESILNDAIRRKTKDSIAINAQDREIKALEIKLKQRRTPRVDTFILDNPELASFVDTQQEIITELKEQVDTLKSALQFREKLFNDLVVSHNSERDISERIGKEQDNRIANLEKQVKKSKRGNRWLKAGAVAGIVSAFFLGAK